MIQKFHFWVLRERDQNQDVCVDMGVGVCVPVVAGEASRGDPTMSHRTQNIPHFYKLLERESELNYLVEVHDII